MSSFLHRFAEEFARLEASNLDRLAELYSGDVHFTDPLHEVYGLAELRRYFSELYANVEHLHFEFISHDEVCEGQGYLRWIMSYRHPRLNGGGLISLEGCSLLRWNGEGKVERHRDYFDAGALLYQHVPLLGGAIRWLQRRLA
ncbi:nuclear transport factor 2 family protein [Stutzerimonas decontaminans]|uniref:Nuclear transport factor 2 family protein n=2 Tax=Stutzerimonas TaxID=2901164 RepID=A0ABX4VUC6_9GAMM|nr:nuclear transport factor 2 family protein [Stutzerimonas decontaminans]AHY43190.1 transcriptional regulator [Stutzerimonas decontaminans]MCQ4246797.1 nuclear transport factor 2 family protein [Stutzerimonas decontaminans]MCW8157830.1 nuclear transport factor 2 family protein [Stutzerimonas stutzeri]PNF83775.1 nuclear transport factor 2 family protein [Stutzerimonas decontaminans]